MRSISAAVFASDPTITRGFFRLHPADDDLAGLFGRHPKQLLEPLAFERDLLVGKGPRLTAHCRRSRWRRRRDGPR